VWPSRKVLAVMIDSSTAEKLEKLFKLALGTDNEGEALGALLAMKRIAGTNFHELAGRIKEGGKLSEADMQRIYNAGVHDGKETTAATKNFNDVEGPSYYQMAQYCAEHDERLSEKEKNFVRDMVRWCARREPSEKQGKWLHVLYVKLGRR
jgi:hypothetical protein